MKQPRSLIVALTIAVLASCAVDTALVYNKGPRTPLDTEVREHFAKHYRVIDVSDKDRTWVYPHGTNPSPTPPANRDGVCVSGQSLVAFVIGADGGVRDAFAIHPANEFLDAFAVDLAMKKRFAPAQLNGQSVPVLASMDFRFVCPGDKR